MKIIDLGCGLSKLPGSIGVDCFEMPGVDVLVDLEKAKLPFKENTIDKVYTSHVLEHIRNLIPLISEVHRILKKKGRFHIIVPYYNSAGAYTIDHKNFFSYNSFNSFVAHQHTMSQYRSMPQFRIVWRKIRFGKRLAVWNYVVEPLMNLMPNVYEQTPLRVFPANELEIVLEKV